MQNSPVPYGLKGINMIFKATETPTVNGGITVVIT